MESKGAGRSLSIAYSKEEVYVTTDLDYLAMSESFHLRMIALVPATDLHNALVIVPIWV